MQKSGNNQVVMVRRQVRSSTTLNRKYVQKPVSNISDKVADNQSGINEATDQTVGQIQNAVKVRMQTRAAAPQPATKLTASQLKDLAIKKALADANRISEEEKTQSVLASSIMKKDLEKSSKKKRSGLSAKKARFGIGRVFLALACATAAVVAIVYFVNANMPDISLKVTAMQTGIDNPYPSYVPRDYSISDVVSEEGKITLNFRNSTTGGAFSLTEERSSWDSGALLSNYVKDAFKENYTVVREQGLTLYMGNNETTWVNGGIVYKLKVVSGTLTKKQIRAIAVSL